MIDYVAVPAFLLY